MEHTFDPRQLAVFGIPCTPTDKAKQAAARLAMQRHQVILPTAFTAAVPRRAIHCIGVTAMRRVFGNPTVIRDTLMVSVMSGLELSLRHSCALAGSLSQVFVDAKLRKGWSIRTENLTCHATAHVDAHRRLTGAITPNRSRAAWSRSNASLTSGWIGLPWSSQARRAARPASAWPAWHDRLSCMSCPYWIGLRIAKSHASSKVHPLVSRKNSIRGCLA